MSENPNFYAIIPASVRYDNNLTGNAKLLYGEITALCDKKGYCWASNSYFAKLYDVSNVTISRWIRSLIQQGYIQSELIYREGSKEIESRYIHLCGEGINKNDNTPINKNVKESTTSLSNTINKDIYDDANIIFDHYLSKSIFNHRKMSQRMKTSINARIKEHGIDEVKKTIDNYADVVKSDKHFFSHKWGVDDLMQPRNFDRFMDERIPHEAFLKDQYKNQQQPQKKKDHIDDVSQEQYDKDMAEIFGE